MKKLFIFLMCLMMLPLAFAGTVTRSVSSANPTSGSTVTVTLTIDATSGDKAIMIHEIAPFNIIGLSNNIYDTAIVDQIQVSDTTKTYSFVAGATGVQTFNGAYRLNGAATDTPIAGVSSITVGGQCTDSAWTPDPSTICSTSNVQQTSNCGATRTVQGTKSCVCTPSCSGKVCGDNGCGTGTCAPGCSGNQTCSSGQCKSPEPVTCEFFESKLSDGSCKTNWGFIWMLGLVVLMVVLIVK